MASPIIYNDDDTTSLDITGKLKVHPLAQRYNNDTSKEDLASIIRSVDTYGFVDIDPVIVSPKGTVLDGINRIKAAIKKKYEEIPCLVWEGEPEDVIDLKNKRRNPHPVLLAMRAVQERTSAKARGDKLTIPEVARKHGVGVTYIKCVNRISTLIGNELVGKDCRRILEQLAQQKFGVNDAERKMSELESKVKVDQLSRLAESLNEMEDDDIESEIDGLKKKDRADFEDFFESDSNVDEFPNVASAFGYESEEEEEKPKRGKRGRTTNSKRKTKSRETSSDEDSNNKQHPSVHSLHNIMGSSIAEVSEIEQDGDEITMVVTLTISEGYSMKRTMNALTSKGDE